MNSNQEQNTEIISQNVKKVIKDEKGMTLIEILIALTLISLMGTFIAGKVFDMLYEGQVKSTKIQMRSFEAQLKEFRRKCGFYPTSDQGLEALLEKPSSGRECKNYPPDGFIEGDEIPMDPWENEYIYTSDGKKFDIISWGQDGAEGGEGKDVDISLRTKKKSSN
ncbi:type II secretion system major pseudopilin GspG [Bacteriovorax sp. DB6_IX]|uniref:type II secretion system major pseudopilin GspG n=1 Tax=Bacteriovorax sp. DB6_IX TaxID=1353530 RepID=UPI00038A2273|nr:type II secretion system major pseudopilin GspG [Bacteriovorax sp. DB6_IX]EQC51033.1 type II secretion system protein G [Bacteriovorax sp. DB6_IX]